jgi:steroid delta-isomerase-like uncharacterized protein
VGAERGNKQLVARIVQTLMNEGRLKEAPRFIPPDVMGRPMGGRGPHEALATIEGLRRAFPDLAFEVDEYIAEGERVVATWVMTGTQMGPFLNVPPSGRAIRVRGMTVFAIRRGQWVGAWGSWDLPHALAQLGAPIAGMAPAAPDAPPPDLGGAAPI